jgi:hypothetical protein
MLLRVLASDVAKGFLPSHTEHFQLPVHAHMNTSNNILGSTEEVGGLYLLLSRNWCVYVRYTPPFSQFPSEHNFLL